MRKFKNWFFGERKQTTEPYAVQERQPDPDPSPHTEEPSPYTGERDRAKQPPAEPAPTPPGWYETEGTLRYFDGAIWTEHRAPLPTLTANRIAGAVFLGVLGALFIVWLGAQAEPDHIYLPVKFVVEDLPEGF